jgi:hypothetical protein
MEARLSRLTRLMLRKTTVARFSPVRPVIQATVRPGPAILDHHRQTMSIPTLRIPAIQVHRRLDIHFLFILGIPAHRLTGIPSCRTRDSLTHHPLVFR